MQSVSLSPGVRRRLEGRDGIAVMPESNIATQIANLRRNRNDLRSGQARGDGLPPDAFKNAVRGKFYRPVKQAVSPRLDADVIAWLKKDGDGYQTRVNRMLRERMLAELKQVKPSVFEF